MAPGSTPIPIAQEPSYDRAVTDSNERLPNESDGLLKKVRELGELEIEKRKEPISSNRFHELAEDVTRRSRAIMNAAAAEEATGNDTERSDESIDDVAARQPER